MSLRLHPEHGVNPFLTVCSRCSGEGRDLILVGADDGVYSCRSCKKAIIGRPRDGRCPACGDVEHQWSRERTLRQGEKLPVGLCEACEKEVAEHKAIVEAGGVYWQCADCKRNGVIKASPFAKLVREAHQETAAPGICFTKPAHTGGVDEAYLGCGAEFTKADCPACGPDPVADVPQKEA